MSLPRAAPVADQVMSQPAVFIPHGGGPCFFMDWNPPGVWDDMREFLERLPSLLPSRPEAILVISAHWEASTITITSGARPGLIYDYGGFPPHTYELTYPAPGHPQLAREAWELLAAAGVDAVLDPDAGWDHGVFIPLKVAWPDAEIPVVSLSLHAGLDPAEHLRIGAVIAPLREQGVLVLGSGSSFHGRPDSSAEAAREWDDWMQVTMNEPVDERDRRLVEWERAPFARVAHPTEEHLVPGFVAAAAGGDEPVARIYGGLLYHLPISAWAFGPVAPAATVSAESAHTSAGQR